MSAPARPAPSRLTKYLGIRVPAQLEQQLSDIAARNHNSVSATIRRLVANAIREEQRRTDRG
jgi:hypothetical protein